MTDHQPNPPIEVSSVQSVEAHPERKNVLVTLKARSGERLLTILFPINEQMADQLAGQLTAAAIQVRRRMRLNQP
jgi:hypothetical protein